MIAHLGAVKTALASLGYPVFNVWAFAPVPAQYVVLGGKAWDFPDEMPVCGRSDVLDTDLRVKAVAGTPEGVIIMLQRIRDLLSPSLAESAVPLTGRHVSIRYLRSEFVDIDQDVTITGSNRHPAFGVDTYHLTSEPS